MIRNRNPREPRRSDVEISKDITAFEGMLTGEPASKIRSNYSALNTNVVDYGDYYKVRSGTRQYTSWRLGYEMSSVDAVNDEITVTGVHEWETGDVVYLYGDSLPTGLATGTAYYAINIDTNTIALASSYSNAVAGTKVNITSDGSGWIYWGEIYAECDHDAQDKIVLMLGESVYVFNKAMTTMQKVLNIHGTNPDDESTMEKHEYDVVLWSGSGIFRIVLDDSFPYMYPINLPVPSTLITDIPNDVGGLIYRYLYLYSTTILEGTGNRSRFDSNIQFESGTCLVSGQAKDYGEVCFDTAIGIVLSETHSIGDLTLPDTVNCATHFTLYRSRNVGEESGGFTSSINGIGNRRDLIIYAADVPVAKSFLVDIAHNNLTLVSGNEFVRGDVSCELTRGDASTATIETFISGTSMSLGGATDGSSVAVAIGGGRVAKASQSGNRLTINDSSYSFAASDVGLKIFVSDGTYRHVTDYVDSDNVDVAETGDFTELAITWKPTVGNFSRKWNDTVPDDPNSDVVGSLEDLYLYGSDIYIPRRQFKPVPDCNIGIIESGFMVAMDRNAMRYYYSQIGDKVYHMGYYKDPIQTKKIVATIRHAVRFPFNALILMRKKTGLLLLRNSSNVGRTEIGENVFELPEMSVIDTERGVNLWQTIKFKNDGLVYAWTDDGAWRYFNGSKWSEENFAYVKGKDAVSKEYLSKIDQSTRIAANYNPWGGFKIFITRNLPNTEPSSTVYEIEQQVQDSEETETVQYVIESESDEINQYIGVAND